MTDENLTNARRQDSPAADDDEYLVVRFSRSGPVRVCAPSGEIDLSTEPVLTSAFLAQERGPVRALVVDLARVRFISVSGVRVLLGAAERARRDRHGFALCGVTGAISRVLAFMAVYKQVRVYENLPAAIKAYRDWS